ncbi:MAG: glutamate-semialdehyde -aminomutase, partial [Actinomycetota bacterium]|nr:glutamate-semialdehyde -aminomutase [Actinomycetota bacterium]
MGAGKRQGTPAPISDLLLYAGQGPPIAWSVMATLPAGGAAGIDPARVAVLTAAEDDLFARTHPRSRELFERAREVMPGGVPMSWMVKWPGAHPVFVAEAGGAHFRDVDGHDY